MLQGTSQDAERWVVNLSGQPLTSPQEEVLKLGLNFAPASTKLLLIDTMAALKDGSRKLTEEEADSLRERICGVLRRA